MKKLFTTAALLTSMLCNAKAPEYITYEQFGAKGDGKTDDQAAIIAAHKAANEKGLPVKANSGSTYYIGPGAEEAIIKTDVDWGDAKFIIDDVVMEDYYKQIFVVEATKKPYDINIPGSLKKGQKNLGIKLDEDALLFIRDDDKRIYIRLGLNQNGGSSQQEMLLLDKDGNIEPSTAPVMDYDQVTAATVYPQEKTTLTIRGGIFVTIANQKESKYDYVRRGIGVQRSNVIVEGVRHYVEGELDHGAPYRGFIGVYFANDVEVRNCVFTGHKTYVTIGAQKLPVKMGTYEFDAWRCINVRMKRCIQTNSIHDDTFWGIYTSNFCKNLSVENCVISRFDAHMGVANVYLKDCVFGYQQAMMVGFGKLKMENCTCYSTNMVYLRYDYGSSWDGDVEFKNCVLRPYHHDFKSLSLIGGSNDHEHNFGYECKLPDNVLVDGMVIEDSFTTNPAYDGPSIFSDFRKDAPVNAILNDVKTESGKQLKPCANPELFKNMTIKSL